LRVEEPTAAVRRGLAHPLIGGTASRRLSSTVETPDGLTPSAQRLVAAAVTTDVLRAVRLHRPRKGRNLLAGVFVTPRADGESPTPKNRLASDANDAEYQRLLLSIA
jgi:hypothetical protein